MNKAGYLKKMRLFLADPDGKIWSDTELYTLIDEALKQYCIDAGVFTGSFDLCPDSNGVYHYPDDFGKFLTGWNVQGDEITPSTARELFVRSHNSSDRTGDVRYIYDDLSAYGDFAVYPLPVNMQNIHHITITPEWGEIYNSDYGVFVSDGYGTTENIDAFDYSGTIYYRKKGNCEDVKDYMAVICYALSAAYRADSDLANSDLSQYWKNIYKTRLAKLSRISCDNGGKQVSVNYF
jgi:hypothetical protein